MIHMTRRNRINLVVLVVAVLTIELFIPLTRVSLAVLFAAALVVPKLCWVGYDALMRWCCRNVTPGGAA